MSSDNSNSKSPLFVPLSNLFRLRLFDVIYAKSDGPNPESSASTPRSPRGPALCPVTAAQERCGAAGGYDGGGEGGYEGSAGGPDCGTGGANGWSSWGRGAAGDGPARKSKASTTKRTTTDRGKTGAGVTGSRASRYSSAEDLPKGAKNPGLLRYLHNAARYRLPQCFEGGSVSVKQTSNSNWILGHTMSFSSVSPSGYRLLLSYANQDRPGSPPYFVMEAAPGGQLSCEVRVGPTSNTRATVVAQIADGELYSFESLFDVYLHSTTASIIAVNKEFIALHLLQAFTKNVSMGAEVVGRGGTELSSISGAARYADRVNSLSATLGNRGVDVCYARNLKPFLTVAAMLEVGFAIRRSLATLAYEWRSDVWTARGSIDSDGLVGATLQRALGGKNANLSCAISALLNHPNDKFRLGFSINAVII